tara:strand:+ start:3436 stop:4086 length:651 start_codon:yes stop_codon:yes gene_type:complete
MAQLNANIPYIQCIIRKEYTGLLEDSHGYMFGVKSMINRPLHFHFQTDFGATIWNMPISAFVHREDYDKLSHKEETRLQMLQSWDCQSNNISVTTFAFLQNKRVDIFCRDRKWRSGKYITTIDDYEGDLNELNVGYSNDQDSKCYHFIEMDDGNFSVQPNNLLRWHNPDFIVPFKKDSPPKFSIFKDPLSSEDIDRSYGNSPYFFYGYYDDAGDKK